MKLKYQDFVNTYPKRYRSAIFYPIFLKTDEKNFKEIRNILGSKVRYSTLYFWFNTKKVPLPFKEFSRIKKEFNTKHVNYLAIIVGHILGDGGITKQKFLRYSNTEEILINEFKRAMKEIFNAKPTVCYKEASGITRLVYPRLFSRVLLCLFGNFSLGKDSKKITSQIDEMSLQWKVKLIRAWYDDDGSVPDSRRYKCITFKQKDKRLILWIQKTLKEVGIKSKLDKDGYYWHLRILNYLDMVKFKDKIGFSKGYRKQLHLEKIIRGTKCPHWKTKLKILELLKEKPRTGRELTDILKINRTVVWSHICGSRRKKRQNTQGLVDMKLVNIKKRGRINIYFLNEKECQKFRKTINKERYFKLKL